MRIPIGEQHFNAIRRARDILHFPGSALNKCSRVIFFQSSTCHARLTCIDHRCLMNRTLQCLASFALVMASILRIQAAVVAYEGFEYASGTSIVGANGGSNWLNAWQLNSSGSGSVYTNAAGSLGYTDSLGNLLVTSSNSAFFGGSPSANNTAQPNRDLLVTRSSGTTWISFVGVRQGLTTNTLPGNPYPRGANLGLFNGASQRLAIGNGSGAVSNTWAILPLGQTSALQASTNSFSQVSLVVVRIDHLGTTSDPDNAYIFINPTLGVQPNTNSAAISSIGANDYSFNRLRHFAGGYDSASGQPNAQFRMDEIRIGDIYADVTPFIGAPKITVNLTNIIAERCGS